MMKKKLLTLLITVSSLLLTNSVTIAQAAEKVIKQPQTVTSKQKRALLILPLVTVTGGLVYLTWFQGSPPFLHVKKKMLASIAILIIATLGGYLIVQPLGKKMKANQANDHIQSEKMPGLLLFQFITILMGLYFTIKVGWPDKDYPPPLDVYKTVKTFLLYKIEKNGKKSYLYGVADVKSEHYTVPEAIKKLQNIDRLVTDVDYNIDSKSKEYSSLFFDKIIEEYDKAPTESAKGYITQVKKYKADNKLHFIPASRRCILIKHNGKAKYPMEELYKLFSEKEKEGLTTTNERLKKAGMTSKSKMTKKIEDAAADHYRFLQRYEHNEYSKMKILSSANDRDENLPILKKGRYNWSNKIGLATKNESEKFFGKIIAMIKEKNNLFALSPEYINYLLLLLLSKKCSITRILENGVEQAVSFDNYNEPFV